MHIAFVRNVIADTALALIGPCAVQGAMLSSIGGFVGPSRFILGYGRIAQIRGKKQGKLTAVGIFASVNADV